MIFNIHVVMLFQYNAEYDTYVPKHFYVFTYKSFMKRHQFQIWKFFSLSINFFQQFVPLHFCLLSVPAVNRVGAIFFMSTDLWRGRCSIRKYVSIIFSQKSFNKFIKISFSHFIFRSSQQCRSRYQAMVKRLRQKQQFLRWYRLPSFRQYTEAALEDERLEEEAAYICPHCNDLVTRRLNMPIMFDFIKY